MNRTLLLLWILLMSAILFACAPKVVPIAKVDEKPSESTLPLTKEGWREEWESTFREARKEGKISLVGTSAAKSAQLAGEKIMWDRVEREDHYTKPCFIWRRF